jgi:Protein of unknown function (DUF2516)
VFSGLFSGSIVFKPLVWLFFLLAIAAFVVEAWAFIDALRRPAGAFVATGKQTRPLWLVILGVSTLVGLYGVTYGLSLYSILPVAAFIAAAIYLTDVRPKVREIGGGGGGGPSHQGPYGPW